MIRFYFDYLSPYAYLAWKEIPALAARHGRAVEPVPVVLAALLQRWGHKGPAEIPPKRAWVFKNVLRHAHRLGHRLEPPPAHPFNPLVALRASTAVAGEEQRRLISALFDATWAGGGGVASAVDVERVVRAAGFDPQPIVAWATSEAAKDRLRADTDAAIAAGVFGVPTMGVPGGHEEIFWGYDSFPDLEDYLSGRDPVDPAALARWEGLPVGAVRR
jgi:2-hydroxychromene-2-carboxylate isomerase